MKEIWKDVKGYEGIYKVSNLGRVKSLDRVLIRKDGKKYTAKGKNLKPHPDKDGYQIVRLKKPGCKAYTIPIHRLVGLGFIDNPKNKPYINHKSGIKHQNDVENLEWCTPSENTKHAIENGFIDPGNNKLSKEDVVYIKYQSNENVKELASKYDISIGTVYHIKQGHSWKQI